MLDKKLLILGCAIAAASTCNATEHADTLLVAEHAKSIQVSNTNSTTSINVFGIDSVGNNFYYTNHVPGQSHDKVRMYEQMEDVKEVVVFETDSAISVKYAGPTNELYSRTFPFSDKANRSQQSYIGNNFSDFMSLNLSSSKSVKWNLTTGGLTLGWVTATDKAPQFSPSMGRSIELGWLNILAVEMKYRNFATSLGLGIDWRNYVTVQDLYFNKNAEGRLELLPYTDEVDGKHRSRVKIFSLQMPLLLKYYFGSHKGWRVVGGPILNFNTSASLKTQYSVGDKSYSIKTSHIGQRPVTVDTYLSISFQHLGLYARYCPMNLFKTGMGIDFNSFSTGIVLGF